MRAVFHEQDDAEAVVVRLRREGWDAMVVRDRFRPDSSAARLPHRRQNRVLIPA